MLTNLLSINACPQENSPVADGENEALGKNHRTDVASLVTSCLCMNDFSAFEVCRSHKKPRNLLCPCRLFDVLHLFAQLFYLVFHFNPEMGNPGIVNFRGQGVDLAQKFLQKEIQSSPDRFLT